MSAASQARRLWVESEDQKLREGVKQQMAAHGAVRDWNRIALALPGRSNKDCRKRWSKISKAVKKGLWDAEEDARLREGIEYYGMRWTQVAEYVGTRHADQCAKRWTHSLDPNLNQSDWTEQEDEVLLAAVSERGRNWKEIAETKLLGRSKSAIKNRYSVAQNKRRDQGADHRPGVSSSNLKRMIASQQGPVREDDSSDDSADSDDENDDSNPENHHVFEGASGNNVDQQYDASWMATGDVDFSSGYTSNSVNWNSLDSSYGVDMMSPDEQAASYVPGSLPHFITGGSMAPSQSVGTTEVFGDFTTFFPYGNVAVTNWGMDMNVNPTNFQNPMSSERLFNAGFDPERSTPVRSERRSYPKQRPGGGVP